MDGRVSLFARGPLFWAYCASHINLYPSTVPDPICCWNSSSSLIAPIGNTCYPTYQRAVHVFQLSIGNPSPSTALDCMLLVEVFPMHPSVILHATLPTTHRASHIDIPTITGKTQRKNRALFGIRTRDLWGFSRHRCH